MTCLQLSDEELPKAKHRGHLGRHGSVRIPVRVEDFIIGYQGILKESTVSSGFNQTKYN
jgi:hypothetical protein